MKCFKCGNENTEDIHFCTNCGNQLYGVKYDILDKDKNI